MFVSRLLCRFSKLQRLAAIAALATFAASPVLQANAADSSATGKLVFWRTSKISTPVMGVIASLPVRVGDQVKQGDVLAEIDTQQLKADLAIAQAALEFARSDLVSQEAKLALDTSDYDRQARLKDSPAFSGARYDDSNNRVAVARAVVAAARAMIVTREAEVAKRELDVRLATIKSPFDGIVVRHLLTVGGLVSIENPHILVVVDSTSPEIEVEVPVDQVPVMKVGREVEFSIGAGSKAREQARVRAVLPSDAPSTETRRVRLEIMNTKARYSDAEPVTVYLPTS